MHSQRVPSFFLTNKMGAPHRDTVLILYGVLDVGTTPSVSSIEKSISLLGGRPGTSSGNTSLYSLNMGWSSRFGFSFSTYSITCMSYKEHPFLQYFFI
jgi:hypothetical protein